MGESSIISTVLSSPLIITMLAGISLPSARTDGGQAMSTAVVTMLVAGIVVGAAGLLVVVKTGKDRKDFPVKVEQLGCCSILTRAIWQSTRTGGGWEL